MTYQEELMKAGVDAKIAAARAEAIADYDGDALKSSLMEFLKTRSELLISRELLLMALAKKETTTRTIDVQTRRGPIAAIITHREHFDGKFESL